MTATIKSRVLVREEKGMGGVSMKRLVFCGLGAGMAYFVVNLSPLHMCSLPTLFVGFVLLIYLSGRRYGVARSAWLVLVWRGRLLLDAYREPSGLSAQFCRLSNLTTEGLLISGGDLLRGTSGVRDVDLSGVEILVGETDGFEILADDEVMA